MPREAGCPIHGFAFDLFTGTKWHGDLCGHPACFRQMLFHLCKSPKKRKLLNQKLEEYGLHDLQGRIYEYIKVLRLPPEKNNSAPLNPLVLYYFLMNLDLKKKNQPSFEETVLPGADGDYVYYLSETIELLDEYDVPMAHRSAEHQLLSKERWEVLTANAINGLPDVLFLSELLSSLDYMKLMTIPAHKLRHVKEIITQPLRKALNDYGTLEEGKVIKVPNIPPIPSNVCV